MKLEKGSLKRLSVAVLVDHKVSVDAAGGRVLTPRTAPEMKTIRDLIVAAAGILETRGDLLTVENLPFEAPEIVPLGPAGPLVVAPPWWESLRVIFSKEWLRRYRYVVIGVLAGILVMVVAIVFWRKRVAKRRKAAPPAAAVQVEGSADRMGKQLADMQAAQRQADDATLLQLTMPQITSNKAMVLRKMLEDSAKKDPSATVQLLRTWIHETDN